jgi:CIC family chloride channel protein
MFAIELMMPEVSVSTFLPVAVATGAATFVGRIFFGQQPAFDRAVDGAAHCLTRMQSGIAPCCTLALGAAHGIVAAAGFIHGLHLAEDLFERKIPWRYLRHMLGMLLRRA